MRRLISTAVGAASGAMLLLSNASLALAQYDDEYLYDYGTSTTGAAAGAGVLGAFWLLWCCFALLGLVFLAFRIWMLVHAIQNAPDDQKTLWIILILLVPIADWVYFFTKKKEWDPKK